MQPKIKVEVIRDKSFDPHFHVVVHYESDTLKLTGIPVSVVRRPPKVTFEYPSGILEGLQEQVRRKLELEIMNRILEHIMHHADNKRVSTRDTRMLP